MAKKSKKKTAKKTARKTSKNVAKKTSKKSASRKSSKKQAAVSKKRKSGQDGRSNPQSWSEKDVERLKKMIMQNTPTSLIAMKLKRSVISVRGKVSRDGLSLAPTNRSPRD